MDQPLCRLGGGGEGCFDRCLVLIKTALTTGAHWQEAEPDLVTKAQTVSSQLAFCTPAVPAQAVFVIEFLLSSSCNRLR